MADKPKADAATPPALPSLDSISSVAVTELPERTRATLDDDARKLAEAIIAATANGNAAVGPKIAGERKDATAAAARIKRLLNSYYTSQGTAPNARPVVETRIVPKDGGNAWAVTISAPKSDAAPEGETVGEAAPDPTSPATAPTPDVPSA